MSTRHRRLLVIACLTACGARRTASDPPAREVLYADGGLSLVRVSWWADGPATTLAVRFPRDATLQLEPSDAVVPFSQLLPDDAGPWAAINGGFYDEKGPMGLVVADGFQHHARTRSGSGVLEAGPWPVRVVHRDAWSPGPTWALQSIDRLVDEGRNLVKPGPARAARSAVVVGPDAVWLVAGWADASARQAGQTWTLGGTSGRGPTLAEWADHLVGAFDAQQALNLDGAVSTQLAVQAGGRRWDVVGERGTVQAVVLRPEPVGR